MCKNHYGGMKAGRGHGEQLRHCESPSEATGKGAVSITVDGPGMKGTCKEVEAWHYSESL
jgi:hypothetical protein